MLVRSVKADPVRILERVELELTSGVTAITGPNGVGKTNLLESLYFGLTGRSFRTTDRRELIPHGGSLARAEVVVEDEDGAERLFLAAVTRAEGRRFLLDGEPADAASAARNRPHIVVFSPDRLQLIKGPPAERRAHLDSFIAARWPARTEFRRRFGQALAQRNAMLSRVSAGFANLADLDSWDQAFAAASLPLIEARTAAIDELAAPFAEIGAELGLPGEPALQYAPRAAGSLDQLIDGLADRRQSDLKLGRSSWGPHLDEIRIDFGAARSLRRYGSQGQQRTGLLTLLFAEREALLTGHGATPILLLDDVMSELDPEHRELLGKRLGYGGQSLITAADRDALPLAAQETGIRFEAPGKPVPN